jgi:hypothetical protein
MLTSATENLPTGVPTGAAEEIPVSVCQIDSPGSSSQEKL